MDRFDRQTRLTAIAERFNTFLARFQPPAYMRGEDAQSVAVRQEEADELLRCIAAAVPDGDWQRPLDELLREIAAGMRTRAWPTQGEIRDAVKRVRQMRAERSEPSAGKDRNVIALADLAATWFAKFGTPPPGSYCDGEVTRALIDRGVLASPQLARFLGFRLSLLDLDAARSAPECIEERRHDEAVHQKLRAWREAVIAGGAPAAGPVRSRRPPEHPSGEAA